MSCSLMLRSDWTLRARSVTLAVLWKRLFGLRLIEYYVKIRLFSMLLSDVLAVSAIPKWQNKKFFKKMVN